MNEKQTLTSDIAVKNTVKVQLSAILTVILTISNSVGHF